MNKEELYNLRHARLRNCVERIIGVLKNRFRLLMISNPYPVARQIKGIYACVLLHNLLFRFKDTDKDLQGHLEAESDTDEGDRRGTDDQATNDHSQNGDTEAGAAMREQIAQDMWNDYIR